jgi:hypothetical protein
MAAKVKAAGGNVAAQWSACIDGAFGPAHHWNAYKMRVQRRIDLGAGHPEVRARFGSHAQRIIDFGFDLDRACAYAQAAWVAQSAAARATGTGRLSASVLDELRLMLRWLRAKRQHRQFAHLLRLATGDEFALEAHDDAA